MSDLPFPVVRTTDQSRQLRNDFQRQLDEFENSVFGRWFASNHRATVESMPQLERTSVAQQHFNHVTGEIPIIVSDGERLDMLSTGVTAGHVVVTGDPFDDDTPLACGIENPESCESCS